MQPNSAKITLGKLANIALGSPIFKKDNLCALQILLMTVMKKLGCQDEIVSISGLQGQQLHEMLKKSQDNTVDVKYENKENFAKKFKRLERLETKFTKMNNVLDKHFSDVAKLTENVEYMPKIWDLYAKSTEDLCTLYMAHNKEFCLMARNPTLILNLRQRAAKPIVEKIACVEGHVQYMTDELKRMLSKSVEWDERMQILGPMINEIELKRSEINKQWKQVQEAVTEIQEMANCKLDRLVLPGMRRHLETQFSDVKRRIAVLQKAEKKVPSTHKIDLVKGACLSCSRASKKFEPLALKLPVNIKCECNPPKPEQSLLQKMQKIQVKSYRVTPLHRKARETIAVSNALRARGHFVQNYTTDEELKDVTMRQIITVVENIGATKHRRSSFMPSPSFMGQSLRTSRLASNVSSAEQVGKSKGRNFGSRISIRGSFERPSKKVTKKGISVHSVLKSGSSSIVNFNVTSLHDKAQD